MTVYVLGEEVKKVDKAGLTQKVLAFGFDDPEGMIGPTGCFHLLSRTDWYLTSVDCDMWMGIGLQRNDSVRLWIECDVFEIGLYAGLLAIDALYPEDGVV